MLNVTVSGSFHRHMQQIYDAVGSFRTLNVNVLSPSDPRVVDYIGDFLFVASDKLRSIKLVQDRHLQAIRSSDFLWVVSPDGYTGQSTSMEIGAAYAFGVPIFSCGPVLDSTIGRYVSLVQTPEQAIASCRAKKSNHRRVEHVLLDPSSSIAEAHCVLDRLEPYLHARVGDGKESAEREIATAARSMKQRFSGY